MMTMAMLLSVTLLALSSMVEGGVLFSTLNKTLVVSAELQTAPDTPIGVAKAGEDHIAVQWSFNSTFAGADALYSKVNIKLCFAPPSQVDRGWRKTKNDLHKDKTCSAANIASQKYIATGNSTVWRIAKKVPGAIYFVRVYAVDEAGVQLAFGQTTNKAKTTNLFAIDPITGRHTSIDVASAIFSVAAIGSLLGFLGFESVMSKRKQSS